MDLLAIIWWIALFVIYWAMVGYPSFLFLLSKVIKKNNVKDYSFKPTVTLMVVAHNEEKVIREKLNNLLSIDYPDDKIDYIIASDYSTDKTNEIVEAFIKSHPEKRIRIHKTVNHYGKTNAQNEAQRLCSSEILVMSDANSMFEDSAVKELVASFSDPSIVYVAGQLKYVNSENNSTANSESFYWKMDLMCRDTESRIKTITAGNGAIYAVRNKEYRHIPAIECHDSSFPVIYGLENKRAIYNPCAIAYEKAGENDKDEYQRKVRMNRIILRSIMDSYKTWNIFKYGWFSIFYFGHRTCRYLLWIMHLIVFMLNIPLALNEGYFWKVVLCLQILFYFIAIVGKIMKSNNIIIRLIVYYSMTIVAQWQGVINSVSGKTKPIWDKANSTR